MKLTIIIFIYGFLIGCSSVSGLIKHVSMVEVIANPKKFKGKEIQLTGYLTLGHERDVLYFDKENAYWGRSENAIRLVLSEEQLNEWDKFKNSYVYVKGYFYPVKGAYFDRFDLELKSITRIDSMLSRDQIREMQKRGIDDYNRGKKESEKIKYPSHW